MTEPKEPEGPELDEDDAPLEDATPEEPEDDDGG